jgi:pentatricopeptide repeat protein
MEPPKLMADTIPDLINQLADPKTRKAAKESLLKMGGSAVEPLIAALESADKNVRITLMSTLADTKDMRAVEPLRKLTHDSDVQTCGWAMRVLIGLNPPDMVDDMKRVALDRIDGGNRSIILRALGKMGRRDDAVYIVERMIADNYPMLEIAVNDLATFADPSMYDLFMGLLKHESHFVVSSAMAGLKAMPDDQVIDAFIALLQDKDPTTRARAATKLAEIGAKRALPAIKPLLNDHTEVKMGADMGEKPHTVSTFAKEAVKKLQPRFPWFGR